MAVAAAAARRVDHLFMVEAAAREQQLELQYMEDLVVLDQLQASYQVEVAARPVMAVQA